ncbi:MAG: uroporphyrinogen decarboxylase [bacterium]|nr:uroporphyrinogen decarboxylase [bacterium]MCP5069294.1 uroporphyrinogen decarboxylase [bacterium]
MTLDPTERMLGACRGEPVDRPPVWLMRQAGRYLPEYRAVRRGTTFLEMCADVEKAVEVSLQPIRLVGSEAVVFFCDIFVPVLAMDVGLDFAPGPIVERPIRTREQVDALALPDFEHAVPYVFEILQRLRAELAADRIPLIGFAGAPFTLATYLVEGRGDPTRTFPRLRELMDEQPELLDALLARLATMTIDYLNAQIDAGVQVVQLFDTWAGTLDEQTYRRLVLPVNRAIVEGVDRSRVPFILYMNDAPHLVEMMVESGADVISVGASVDLGEAARLANGRASLQGNLAPEELALPREQIFERVRALAAAGRAARGHILNLGHGCLPETPVEGVRAFTDAARALSAEG